MAQYDIPILQQNASGEYVRTTLAAAAARQAVTTDPSTRAPSLHAPTYGSIYVEDGSTATTIGTIDTWTQFTQFVSNGTANGTTPDHTTDDITISETGVYLVGYHVSLIGAAASDEIEIAVFKNNGATQVLGSMNEVTAETAANRAGAATVPVVLNAGDTVELWMKNITAGRNVTVHDATLWVAQLL